MLSDRPSAAEALDVEIDGRSLKLTNLDKVLWPRTGTTKRDLLEYYERVAPVLLPHLVDRPLTLGRYPDGVEGVNWYQTTCPHPPAWMPTHATQKPRGGGTARDYCLVNELAALVWVVNLGSIELHPLLARTSDITRPTVVVFDLDPGAGASFVDCCRVAQWLRELLDDAGLQSFPKTSGSIGLHVYTPLNTPHLFADTKSFARDAARRIANEHPDDVVDRMELSDRPRKVFIDWAQNDPNKSTAAPYSLRAMPWPIASTPLTWDEVEEAAGAGTSSLVVFDARALLTRVETHGDLFAPVLRLEQSLPSS